MNNLAPLCSISESASCTHISALLHALTGLAPSTLSLGIQETDDEEETVPVTSQLCKWNVPQKRKDSAMPMSTSVFEKHDYSKPVKHRLKSLHDFDPRPPEFRGTATSRLPTLLNNIRGQQLCISLLFDEKCQYKADEDKVLSGQTSSDVNVPDLTTLKQTISAFKESLHLNDDQIREVEQATRDQRLSPRWYSERRFRITASNFGTILHRKESTPPDKLVIRLLQQKTFSTPATQYGIANEHIAIAEYVGYQHSHGHTDLAVSPSGFNVCSTHPYLGASPDGSVYDPSNIEQPFGFLELKCPFTARDIDPTEACHNSGFCCTLDESTGCLVLKERHAYFAQVQGQMAIGCRPWCDFVIYTKKGISVQRITYNEQYWKNTLLPKLTFFYDNCMAPEIVSPVHALGIPLRNLSKI